MNGLNESENFTISCSFSTNVWRLTRFNLTSMNGGKYVGGWRVLNDGGNCGQRGSFEPGKQYDGVVIVCLHPSIVEPGKKKLLKLIASHLKNGNKNCSCSITWIAKNIFSCRRRRFVRWSCDKWLWRGNYSSRRECREAKWRPGSCCVCWSLCCCCRCRWYWNDFLRRFRYISNCWSCLN